MANTEASQRLQKALRKVRGTLTKVRNGKSGLGEEQTKKAFIEPVLQGLGWDVHDPFEVHPEYKGDPKGNPVDYALLDDGAAVIFIEAKALDVNLDDVKWQGQIAAYAAVAGVKWCILTDGDVYSIYNLFAPGDIKQKLFRSITISTDREEVFTVLGLLAKEVFPERLDECWQTDRVDQRVDAALREMFAAKDTKLVNAIRARVKDLKPADIRSALERADVSVLFPSPETGECTEGDTPDEHKTERVEWGPRSYEGPLQLDGSIVVLRKWRPLEKELREERVSLAQIEKTAEAALALTQDGKLVSLPQVRQHHLGPSSLNPTQRAMGILYLTDSLEFTESGHTDYFRVREGLSVEAMLGRVRAVAQATPSTPEETGTKLLFSWDVEMDDDGNYALHCSYRPDPTRDFSVSGRRVPSSADFKPLRKKLLDEIFAHIEPLFPHLVRNRIRAKAWSGVHRIYPSKEYGGK